MYPKHEALPLAFAFLNMIYLYIKSIKIQRDVFVFSPPNGR